MSYIQINKERKVLVRISEENITEEEKKTAFDVGDMSFYEFKLKKIKENKSNNLKYRSDLSNDEIILWENKIKEKALKEAESLILSEIKKVNKSDMKNTLTSSWLYFLKLWMLDEIENKSLYSAIENEETLKIETVDEIFNENNFIVSEVFWEKYGK